jgi:hypothetical protein
MQEVMKMSRFKKLKHKFKAPSKQVVRKNLSQDAMMIAARNKFADIERCCRVFQRASRTLGAAVP